MDVKGVGLGHLTGEIRDLIRQITSYDQARRAPAGVLHVAASLLPRPRRPRRARAPLAAAHRTARGVAQLPLLFSPSTPEPRTLLNPPEPP